MMVEIKQEKGEPLFLSEPSSQAVAVLSGLPEGEGIRILDVSAEYVQFWGGERDHWLGASPKIVHQASANEQLICQLNSALACGKLSLGCSMSGLDHADEAPRSQAPRPLIEWRVTAMSMPGYADNVLVLVQRDITQRVEKEAELKRLATTDMLTGLMNRSRFDYLLKHELGRLNRYVRPFSLIMLDIDYFKTINDSQGHDVGDQVLRALATLLENNLRTADYCARWGGEEFMILAPETSLDQAAQLAEKIRQRISSASFPGAEHVTVSLGVAEATHSDTPKSMLKRVDNALYQAKESGRDRVAC
ncbi:GGDEF domain-containing protein [Halomonas sp. 707B3]|uniref:GGDEF domain-containing protein n=1 Tax=Halomonas sp. 707B3 TaxID=1681043 RepID=UPI00209D66D3|nr:GGDEF domain-containing protein [Halomonas sp. 707B3]MCP1317948.1 GGDEF domain-containing protein [Halomonas sp. 707B3]